MYNFIFKLEIFCFVSFERRNFFNNVTKIWLYNTSLHCIIFSTNGTSNIKAPVDPVVAHPSLAPRTPHPSPLHLTTNTENYNSLPFGNVVFRVTFLSWKIKMQRWGGLFARPFRNLGLQTRPAEVPSLI